MRGFAGALVLGEDVDATLVARLLRPSGGEEGVDDGQRLLLRVHPATDADQLSVVVLTRQLGGLDAPREGATRTGNLVGGDLLAVPLPPRTIEAPGSATVRCAAATQKAG